MKEALYGASVIEAEVNLAVRSELKVLLIAGEASVHEVAPLDSRHDRVADAESADFLPISRPTPAAEARAETDN